MRITFCILQDPNCTDPVETKCKHGCIFYQDSDGKQRRRCASAPEVAFLELDGNEKKCFTMEDGAQFCYCNYDGCNKNLANPNNANLANPTSLASLTLLVSLMLALSISG